MVTSLAPSVSSTASLSSPTRLKTIVDEPFTPPSKIIPSSGVREYQGFDEDSLLTPEGQWIVPFTTPPSPRNPKKRFVYRQSERTKICLTKLLCEMVCSLPIRIMKITHSEFNLVACLSHSICTPFIVTQDCNNDNDGDVQPFAF